MVKTRVSRHVSGVSLPKHFEEMETADGRKYYTNHNDKTTTWVDPRDAITKKISWNECDTGETPFGWEFIPPNEEGENGYWIDHNTQNCTIDDPRYSKNRIEEEQLVKQRVEELKQGLRANRSTLRKHEGELIVARKAMEASRTANEDNAAQRLARMSYRRALTQTCKFRRIVEEGEENVEALENIRFEQLSVTDADKVNEELRALNEKYANELQEKEALKSQLLEMSGVVSGYMKTINPSVENLQELATEAARVEIQKLVKEMSTENLLEDQEPSEAVAGLSPENAASEEPSQKPHLGPSETVVNLSPHPQRKQSFATIRQHRRPSSINMKIELEQRKLEMERQRKEVDELRRAQIELKKLKVSQQLKEQKEKEAHQSSAKIGNGNDTARLEIEEQDLPDWLFNANVMKVLSIDEGRFNNGKDLQHVVESKVNEFMEKQKGDADALDFHSKLAFFTTLEIHDNVNRNRNKRLISESKSK